MLSRTFRCDLWSSLASPSHLLSPRSNTSIMFARRLRTRCCLVSMVLQIVWVPLYYTNKYLCTAGTNGTHFNAVGGLDVSCAYFCVVCFADERCVVSSDVNKSTQAEQQMNKTQRQVAEGDKAQMRAALQELEREVADDAASQSCMLCMRACVMGTNHDEHTRLHSNHASLIAGRLTRHLCVAGIKNVR